MHAQDLFAAEHRGDLGRLGPGGAVEDGVQVLSARKADVELEEEAVQLRFREWVGALALQGILRRKHEKGLVEAVGHAANGDGVLLHRFEQRALGLGRRAVDLVGEHDVGKDRPLAEGELLLVIDHRRPEDVGGHQIGRELHPRELEREGVGDGAHEERLAQPGHPLQERVRADQQAGQGPVDDLAVTDDDLSYLFAERPDLLLEPSDIVPSGGFGHDPTVSTRPRRPQAGATPAGG